MSFFYNTRVASLTYKCAKVVAINMIDLKTGKYNMKMRKYVPFLPISLKGTTILFHLTNEAIIFSYLERKKLLIFPKEQCQLLLDPNLTSLNLYFADHFKRFLNDSLLKDIVMRCTCLSILNISRIFIV